MPIKNETAAGEVKGQSGFTLVEMIIATLVLAVGLLMIAAAFTNGMRILAATPMQIAAKELAATVIDDLTLQKDTGLPLSPSNGARQVCTGQEPNRVCQTFNVETKITDNADGVIGLRHIEVTVTYTSGGIARRYVKATNLGS